MNLSILSDDGRDVHDTLEDLKSDLQRITKSLHCEICTELFCEPFALACGHTFCYSCTCDWLKTSKTCPTCRAKVIQEPSHVFILKEM